MITLAKNGINANLVCSVRNSVCMPVIHVCVCVTGYTHIHIYNKRVIYMQRPVRVCALFSHCFPSVGGGARILYIHIFQTIQARITSQNELRCSPEMNRTNPRQSREFEEDPEADSRYCIAEQRGGFGG